MSQGKDADIGVTGLAVMGRNLARNFARHGHVVALHNRSAARTRSLVAEHGGEGTFVPSESMADFVASLRRPRAIVVMVKAGEPTDAVIDELVQLIAEASDLMRAGLGASPAELAGIFRTWNEGDLDSFLIQITAEVLAHTDGATGKPFINIVLDQAEQKGTGRWTVQSALDLGIPITGIAEATFARSLSGHADQREAARKAFGSDVQSFGLTDRDAFVEDVRRALYASKVVAYAQGFDHIAAGSAEYGWNVDRGAMATIWRGGCIIRARFLDRIREAYDEDPALPSLLVAPYFADAVRDGVESWRRVVAQAAAAGIPVPAFSASLAYYDGLRRERLPAALIQGLRDNFGAHTYHRVDADGAFHTGWAGDLKEHPA